jgi:hypothetical protein
VATGKAYGRHRPAADEIYCTMMAELTGEAPENYRGRPFDADLFDFKPSDPLGGHGEELAAIKWPWPKGTPIKQEFGPPPGPHVPPGGHPDPRTLPGWDRPHL